VEHELYMCGTSDTGQLGTGRRDREVVPVKLALSEPVVSVSCGVFHTLILRTSGTVLATGGNTFGQLGDGTKRSALKPVELRGLSKVQQISCSHHSAAVTTAGELFLWGTGVFGELLQPTLMLSERVTQVSVGGCAGVAVDSFGRVWTWGSNSNGELGQGDFEPRKTPTQVSRLAGVNSAVSGGSFSLAFSQPRVELKEVKQQTPQFKAGIDSKLSDLETELRAEVTKRHSLAEENRRLVRRLERPIDIKGLEERLDQAQTDVRLRAEENESLKDRLTEMTKALYKANQSRGRLEEELAKAQARIIKLERKPPPLMSPRSDLGDIRSQPSSRKAGQNWLTQTLDLSESRMRTLSRVSHTTQGSSQEPTAKANEDSPRKSAMTSPTHVSLQDFKVKLAAIQSNKLALEAKMTEYELKVKARRCS
jgi:hypothetical protein